MALVIYYKTGGYNGGWSHQANGALWLPFPLGPLARIQYDYRTSTGAQEVGN